MNTTNQTHRSVRGFTLIELLVVIFIIAVLAGLLIPAVAGAKTKAKKAMAKAEMSMLKLAITHYEADYSVYPTTSTNLSDITFSASVDLFDQDTMPSYTGLENSDVLDILRDVHPDATGARVNGNPRNPRHTTYMEIKPATSNTSPGVGSDGVYRDPWGNPYIITWDTDDTATTPVYKNVRQSILIWSLGPDEKANKDINHPDNKDNVLSWK